MSIPTNNCQAQREINSWNLETSLLVVLNLHIKMQILFVKELKNYLIKRGENTEEYCPYGMEYN